MENLTLKQFNNLKNEFVEFQINEMTTEDMVSYVRDICLLYTSPSPRDTVTSRMPSSA